MPTKAIESFKSSPQAELKQLLIGTEKSGKSNLATTGRKPVLVFDLDNRAEAIAGKSGVYILSMVEPPGTHKQPTRYSELLNFVAMLEDKKPLKEFGFTNAPDADKPPQTIVIDSIYSLTKSCSDYAMYLSPSLRREIKIGQNSLYFASGWDTWNADVKMVEEIVLRILGIRDVDKIFIFHEEFSEKTNRWGVYPRRHDGIVKFFNEVWRITRSGSVVKAQLLPDSDFPLAATTLVGVPNVVESPNIEKMLREYSSAKTATTPAIAGLTIK